MTKELLESYSYICARIAELEKRERDIVTDTVSGSSPESPYTQHPIKIKGIARLTPAEEKYLERLRRKKEAVEDWFDDLPKTSERELGVIELHIFKGLSWKKVFRLTSHRSPDAARKCYERALQKYL